MVLLTITPTILSALDSLPPSSRSELSLPVEPLLKAPISHTQIITLSRNLSGEHRKSHQKDSQDTDCDIRRETTLVGHDLNKTNLYSLDTLLHGTALYIPLPPPKPEPSAEYLALKSRLQAAAEANAYNDLLQPGPISGAPHRPSLIFPSSSPHISAPSLGNNRNDNEDEDPLSPSLVLNILLSILLTGFSTYWAVSHFRLPSFLLFIFSSSSSVSSSQRMHESYPGSRSSGPVRVFISLAAAVVVGVAEVVIYAAYLRKVRIARAKEGRIVEQKKVGFAVRGVEEVKQVGGDGGGEKEEIWGRGANGGVRRRVREKWEEKKGE